MKSFTQFSTPQPLKKVEDIFCNSIDGCRVYYAKWNKPVRKRKIPHGFMDSCIHMYNEQNKQQNKTESEILNRDWQMSEEMVLKALHKQWKKRQKKKNNS